MTVQRAVIIANGDPPSAHDLARWLRAGDLLICADGGARVALRAGLAPALVIGDFDSLSDAELDQLAKGGAHLTRHPREKDETDLELALNVAAGRADEIIVLGALGGRLDHAFANIMLLSLPALAGHEVIIAHGAERIRLIDARERAASMRLHGAAGDTVSLLPLGGDARGIITDGLRYPLRDETLFVSAARGVSNEMTGVSARVTVSSGMLLCVMRDRRAQ